MFRLLLFRDEGVDEPGAFAGEPSGLFATCALVPWAEGRPLYATRRPLPRKAGSSHLSWARFVISFVVHSGPAVIQEFIDTSGQCAVITPRDPTLWPWACARKCLRRQLGLTQPRWCAGSASLLRSSSSHLKHCFCPLQSGPQHCLARLCVQMRHVQDGCLAMCRRDFRN